MRRSALIAMALSLMLSAHAAFAQQHEHGTSAPAVAHTARGHSVTLNSSPGEAMGYLSLRCTAADRRILCALPSAMIRSKLLIPHDICLDMGGMRQLV
jgi:hypothetical protein